MTDDITDTDRPRPKYETPADLSCEQHIANIVRASMGYEFKKVNPRFYPFDFAVLHDASVIGVAEVKDRDLRYGYGNGFWISSMKVARVNAMAYFTGIQGFIFARFDDGKVRYLRGLPTPSKIIWAGRQDRGDPYDMEPMAVYPWQLFLEV